MNTTPHPRAIVVGVDGSPSSIAGLRTAAVLASALHLDIEAITTWQFPVTYDRTFPPAIWSPETDAGAVLDAAIKTAYGDDAPQGLMTRVVAGSAAGVLIRRSETAEYLIIGSRGRGGFAGLLLGSVSAACAQHAKCPVLIMHGDAASAVHSDPSVQEPALSPAS